MVKPVNNSVHSPNLQSTRKKGPLKNSYSSREITPDTGNAKSKVFKVAVVIALVAGAVFIALSALGYFGGFGTLGYISTMAVGSSLELGALAGIISLCRSKNPSKAKVTPQTNASPSSQPTNSSSTVTPISSTATFTLNVTPQTLATPSPQPTNSSSTVTSTSSTTTLSPSIAFIEAIEKNKPADLLALIENYDPKELSKDMTSEHKEQLDKIALHALQYELLHALLTRGYTLSLKDRDCSHLLFEIYYYHKNEYIPFFLENGADVPREKIEEHLLLAIRIDLINYFEFLFPKTNTNNNTVKSNIVTPERVKLLYEAARHGSSNIIEFLYTTVDFNEEHYHSALKLAFPSQNNPKNTASVPPHEVAFNKLLAIFDVLDTKLVSELLIKAEEHCYSDETQSLIKSKLAVEE